MELAYAPAGAWLIDVVYGRFGASGQCIRYAMENKDEAWKLMRRSMRGAIKPLAEP